MMLVGSATALSRASVLYRCKDKNGKRSVTSAIARRLIIALLKLKISIYF